MATKDCLLAIDQGTTSTRTMAFDLNGAEIARSQVEFAQHYPRSGWVEHDAEEIWDTVVRTCREVVDRVVADGWRPLALGITNQRETTVLWDRATGKPVARAIVWQDRRTADTCRRLKAAGHEPAVTAKTGLLLDPYFSATKIGWLLDRDADLKARAERGEIAFGTIESYLVARLTGGAHVTDVTNASRTLVFDINAMAWDDGLLDLFGVPRAMMPEPAANAGDFGVTDADLFGWPIKVAGMAGDQQAAAIGQACLTPGAVKSTYGTGCFLLQNTGATPVYSSNRLLTTVAYRVGDDTAYALEGSIFVAGAAIHWLRDGLGLIERSADCEALAAGIEDNRGVYMVPAFTGLGAPHWDADARGVIVGLTRATGRAELARAALESVAYQTAELVAAVAADAGQPPSVVRVDGGMAENDWFVQFLADVLDTPVERPVVTETTALGAAFLAGLGAGCYHRLDAVGAAWQRERRFESGMDADLRARNLAGWRDAVSRCLSGEKVTPPTS